MRLLPTRRAALRALAAGTVATLGALAVASPAAADAITIREVDTKAFPQVTARIVVSGQAPDAGQLNVQEDGRYVQLARREAVARSGAVGSAIVVDGSSSMADGGKLEQTKAMARRIVAEKAPSDQLAIVTAGPTATVLTGLTADAGALNSAIDRLSAGGGTALHDAVRLGAGLFGARPELQAGVLVVTDGRDDASRGTFDEARATVLSSKAAVRVLAITGAQALDASPLRTYASASGGAYTEVRDVASLPDLGAAQQRNLSNEFLLEYTSSAKAPFSLTVSYGRLSATKPLVTAASIEAAVPTVTEEAPTRSIWVLRSGLGAAVVALLIFLALGAAVFAGLEIFLPDRHEMDATLGRYSIDPADLNPVERDATGSVVSTPVLRRAVAITERLASRRGLLATIESRLEQAELKLRAGEVALFTVLAAAILAVVGSLLIGPIIGLVLFLVALLAPFAFLSLLASRRRAKFTSQLPDMLNLLAAVLRSGYAVLQGIDAVSKEVAEPMAGELRRVLAEAQLGRDVSDALKECAERMQSPDFDWAVMAIAIQREVGGNLAELLSTVADTMVQRERLRREVKGLTAEGRMSAYVLGLLTPGVGLAMFVMNPDYIKPLYTETTGQLLLGGSVLAAVGGFFWMNRMIQIDV